MHQSPVDSLKARVARRERRATVIMDRDALERTIGDCVVHKYSTWDPRFPTCYMGGVKGEQCKRKEAE